MANDEKTVDEQPLIPGNGRKSVFARTATDTVGTTNPDEILAVKQSRVSEVETERQRAESELTAPQQEAVRLTRDAADKAEAALAAAKEVVKFTEQERLAKAAEEARKQAAKDSEEAAKEAEKAAREAVGAAGKAKNQPDTTEPNADTDKTVRGEKGAGTVTLASTEGKAGK